MVSQSSPERENARDTTLVLFDIDGTLLQVHGAGREAFAACVERVFGKRDAIEYITFSGNTDLAVLRRIADVQGFALTDEACRSFFQALPVELERTVARAKKTLFPGVRELLQVLEADPDIVPGIVTGNIARCARIKLRQFDLHGHFVLGAYGHEDADRVRIAAMAIERARRHVGPDRRIAKSVLIGDTPADIHAAQSVGATPVGVCTGAWDEARLREAGASWVLKDLSDMKSVMHIIK